MRNRLKGFILFIFTGNMLYSQAPDSLISFESAYKRSYYTTRLRSAPPVIDGKLDDDCWNNDGEWSQNFIQNAPVERGQPSFPTRIKILFDDKNIFFALRAWDPEPDKINRFVGNRDDNSIGDLISVAFDTYHDYRAAPEFNINAGGNKTDLIVTDNLSVNLNWNAVWEGKTAVNDSSWTVEFRIPLTQLRYNHSDTGMVWGLHVRRIIRRIQETDQWSLIPRKNSGHVYSFGTMYGLKGIQKPRLVEFLPYVSARLAQEPVINGSPYSKPSRWNANAGIDGKFGIGDFTLDITVNPDFGQIEADPSVMNLTSFETFYEEKRPFFLEGKHLFDFSADMSQRMFYSRRIGHAPTYHPPIDNITSFSRVPEFTNIINAVKISGTTRNGVSVGIMQSTTQKERAWYTVEDNETRPLVEPLASYTVARLQKVANKGNTQAGAMFTSVNRDIEEEQLNPLNKNAFVGGIDFLQYINDREYFIDFKGMISHINGEQEAMLLLQQNTQHYFQRPDAENYLGVDSTRRSLSGTGGYLNIGRQGNKKFIFSEKIGWSSPGFDLNDAGYLQMADLVLNHTKFAFRQTDPGKLFRNYTLTIGQMNGWNYGGRFTYHDLNAQFTAMFHNRWELNIQEFYIMAELATRLLRGGPALRLSPYWQNAVTLNTDKSKRMMFQWRNTSSISSDGISRNFITEPSLTLRLGNHFYIYSNFMYSYNRDNNLYVTTVRSQDEMLYIMARIMQHTYNFTFRVNYNITPDISIQYYGSPFVSSGIYNDFKYALDVNSKDPNQRTRPYNSEALSAPDFSFREFRSNLVARWEYRPGSTIYLVWENRRQNRENFYHSSLGHNLNEIFGTRPVNIFMIKMSFWLGL